MKNKNKNKRQIIKAIEQCILDAPNMPLSHLETPRRGPKLFATVTGFIIKYLRY